MARDKAFDSWILRDTASAPLPLAASLMDILLSRWSFSITPSGLGCSGCFGFEASLEASKGGFGTLGVPSEALAGETPLTFSWVEFLFLFPVSLPFSAFSAFSALTTPASVSGPVWSSATSSRRLLFFSFPFLLLSRLSCTSFVLNDFFLFLFPSFSTPLESSASSSSSGRARLAPAFFSIRITLYSSASCGGASVSSGSFSSFRFFFLSLLSSCSSSELATFSLFPLFFDFL